MGGTRCDVRDRHAAVTDIISRASSHGQERPLAVASSNLDHIYHFAVIGTDVAARSSDIDWLVLVDGAPIAAWARLAARVPAEVLTGSDLLPLLLDRCESQGVRVGFLGGSQRSQRALADRLAVRWPLLSVAGMWSPTREVVLDTNQSAAVAAAIAESRTDLLVVGLGKPRQENWIARHGAATGAGALLAFGASADFVAGVVPRAPAIVSRLGLEWVFRLVMEPRRLYRRYLLQGPRSALRLLTCSTVLDTGQERRRAPSRLPTGEPRSEVPTAVMEGRRITDVIPRQVPHHDPGGRRVSALVVTYNSERHVGPLIESLIGSPVDEVVVVDNGSTDGTVLALERERDRWAGQGLDVHVIAAGRNGGYAAGINIARRHVRSARWTLILNPDVEVAPGAVDALLEVASRTGAGAVVPSMLDGHGRRYESLRREPSVVRALGDAVLGSRFPTRPGWASETVRASEDYEREGPVDWATGAAILVSGDCSEAVGDWDERFFLFSEETDFLRRVREAGYAVRYVPAAQVTHSGSGSGSSDRLMTLMTLNRVRYYSKYHGRFGAGLFRAAVALHCGLRPWQPASRAALLELVGGRASRWPRPPAGGLQP